MNKILTIVVPSYNTEKYIDDCLPTMLEVSNREILEILLINDGSKDNTLGKLNDYMELYPECIRVINKENGGHGSVINRGILEANGKYFKVIDGDDWVKTENLERFLKELQNSKADVIVNSYICFHEQKKKEKLVKYNLKEKKEIVFENLPENISEFTLHAITYKTELLKQNKLRFREKCFYEDSEYILYPIKYVSSVEYMDFPVYVYRVGSVTQSVNPERAFANRKMHYLVVKDCLEFWLQNEKKLSKEKQIYCSKIITKRVISQYVIYFKSKIDENIIRELLNWDNELINISEDYYKKANKFPINFLRLDIKKNAKIVWGMFKIYYKLKD